MATTALPQNPPSGVDDTMEKQVVADVKFAALSSDAKDATDKEHAMTLREGIRKYPKAIAWSLLLSLAVAMEGYGEHKLYSLQRPEANREIPYPSQTPYS
jgi:hypothetical protein